MLTNNDNDIMVKQEIAANWEKYIRDQVPISLTIRI